MNTSTSALAPKTGTGGLFVTILPGSCYVNNSLVLFNNNTVVAIPKNKTSFIFLDTTAGIITVNQTGFPASGCFPIATATTGVTDVLSLTDNRPDLFLAGGSGGTPLTMDTIAQGSVYNKQPFNQGSLPVIYNGNFEATNTLPPPNWFPNNNATVSYETASPYKGLQTLKMVSAGGTGAAVFYGLTVWAVQPGDTILLKGIAKSDGVVSAALGLQWLDATQTAIGGTVSVSTTSTSYTPLSLQATAVANSVYVGILVLSTPAASTGTSWFDEIEIYKIQPSAFLKKGTGSGNYTSASTGYADVDATNLALTVTIPIGFKLMVHASGAATSNTAAATVSVSLFDSATLLETQINPTVAGTGGAEPFSLGWIITGDGASHTVKLQYKTSNASDSVVILNSSATLTPTITFLMLPSS